MTQLRDALRRKSEDVLERRRHKMIGVSLTTSRQAVQMEAVRALAPVHPELAAQLYANSLMAEAIMAADEGKGEISFRSPVPELLERTAEILRKDFDADISCGHGHGWETQDRRCDGTMYSTCWVVLTLSWT